MTPFPAPRTPFPNNDENNKGSKNGRNPPSCFFSVSLTAFPWAFPINKEVIGAINASHGCLQSTK